MTLNKKLGIWGKDKIVQDGKFHASDYYCVRCYSENKKVQADNFWPIMDPDIPQSPYCNNCIKELQLELIFDFPDFNKDF